MTALIIGGDDIEGIKKEIAFHGVECATHWDGRKTRDVRKSIPRDTTLVVIMFDCVNHNLVHKEAVFQSCSPRVPPEIRESAWKPSGPAVLELPLPFRERVG